MKNNRCNNFILTNDLEMNSSPKDAYDLFDNCNVASSMTLIAHFLFLI